MPVPACEVFSPEWKKENQIFDEHVSELIQKILGKFHWNIKAILVYGSAATREYISFPEDIDILVVSHFYDPFLFQRVKSVLQKAPIRIEVGQISLSDFRKLRTMQLVDAKNTGVVIYGDKEILTRAKTDNIYGYEGIKVLFNFGVMRHLRCVSKSVLLSDELSREQKRFILSSCVKAYEGICACLLVLQKRYKLGYGTRADYFSKIYRKEFPSLHKEIPDLDCKIKLANDLRRNGLKYDGNAKDLWFRVRRDVEHVIPFAIADFLDRSQTKSLLRSILMLNTFPHDIVSLLIYTFRLFLYQKKIPPPTIFSVDPASKLYIAGACLLFSFDSCLNFNEEFLKIAERNLSSIFPIRLKKAPPIDRWEKMREVCTSLRSIVSQWHMNERKTPL